MTWNEHIKDTGGCECSHRRQVHAGGNGACAVPGCGCTRYRRTALALLPRTPAVVAGTVERPPRVAVVTRLVSRDEQYNFLGRDAGPREQFFVCTRPTYGTVDTDHAVALTEQPDGGYPFFEFPLDAVRIEGRP